MADSCNSSKAIPGNRFAMFVHSIIVHKREELSRRVSSPSGDVFLRLNEKCQNVLTWRGGRSAACRNEIQVTRDANSSDRVGARTVFV